MKTTFLTLITFFSISINVFAKEVKKDAPKNNNETSLRIDVKRIIKTQRVITNCEGKTGVYIYYVLPGSHNFNPVCHRFFLTESDFLKLKINI